MFLPLPLVEVPVRSRVAAMPSSWGAAEAGVANDGAPPGVPVS
jgi:hypothetical protein